MRQLALITAAAAALSFSALASTQEMDQIYSAFQKTRSEFFNEKNLSKKEFKKRFDAFDSELSSKYKAFKLLEKEDLSAKGNQMAFDLEQLEPLRDLATSQISKEDCSQALHTNSLNAGTEDKKEIEQISLILKSVCK